MTIVGDWGDIIDEVEAERFVGREQELEFFQHHIVRTPPRFLIFYITGQAGVGKTTLLNRYRDTSRELGFLLADCDEQQKDVPSALGRFAQLLKEQNYVLSNFSERYKTYRQKLDEIENDPQAPQGLAAMLGRTMARAAFIGGDFLPGLRKGFEYLPQESIEAQAGAWADYLAKKLTNKDEVALVREPVPILTALFFEDLNKIAQKHKLLLCFDNFEATRQELQEWLLRLPEYKPSQNIRMAIASRSEPGARWDQLRGVTATIYLDIFSEQDAEIFLDIYGIEDGKRRKEILQWSGRLPVLMSWLAAPQGKEPDPLIPTSDIVERFLRWVDQPVLREVALRAALPRVFNADILKSLLMNDEQVNQIIDVQIAFDWLQTMPFVKRHTDGWQYHEIVRRMMLKYQCQKSPDAYRKLQTKLARFYNEKRSEYDTSNNDKWKNERWRKNSLLYIYHLLLADQTKNWMEFITLFTVAIQKRRTFATSLLELLIASDVSEELSYEQQDLIKSFRQQLRNMKEKDFSEGFKMFDLLCHMPDLSTEAKGKAFAYRGKCYQLRNNLENALNDFQHALTYTPSDSWILVNRAMTYQRMGCYEEALADFDQVLAQDDKHTPAILYRTATYLSLRRYEEALADANRVLDQDDKSSIGPLGLRGLIYRAMGRYEEALTDLNQVLAQDDKHVMAIRIRAEIYQAMERYEEALTDLNQVLAQDDKHMVALSTRAEIYQAMECYEEALTDLNQVLAQDDKDRRALLHRVVVYLNLGRSEEALADVNQVLAQDDEIGISLLGLRGLIYRTMGRYEEALADLNQVLAQDNNNLEMLQIRTEIYQAMERYEEALADADQILALDYDNLEMLQTRAEIYCLMGRYEEALTAIDQILVHDNDNLEMLQTRAEIYRLMGRYEESLYCFNQIISLNPTAIDDIYMSRGLVFSYIGHYAEAIENYEQGFEDTPNNYRSYYNIAVAMVKWKGLPDAQANIDEARSILLPLLNTSDRGAVLYGLGGLEALVDNNEQALDYLEEAILIEKEAFDWAHHDVAWLNLRNNPRFQMLISRQPNSF